MWKSSLRTSGAAHPLLRKHRTQINVADLPVLNDLLLLKPPSTAGDELAEVFTSRHENSSVVVPSNRLVNAAGPSPP